MIAKADADLYTQEQEVRSVSIHALVQGCCKDMRVLFELLDQTLPLSAACMCMAVQGVTRINMCTSTLHSCVRAGEGHASQGQGRGGGPAGHAEHCRPRDGPLLSGAEAWPLHRHGR